MGLLLSNGTIVDPEKQKQVKADVLIENDKIAAIEKNIPTENHEEIDARGKLIAPGFIDLHCHLRQPGMEDAETIFSGTRAAAKGGFTEICCMPNTTPAIDHGGMVEYVLSEARRNGCVKVHPVGAITKNRAGEELSEIAELKEMGCCAITDDGTGVSNSLIMRRAFEYAKLSDVVIAVHCENHVLVDQGVINESAVSTRLGLRGMPALAESSMVARDIALCELASSRVHIQHVSTLRAVEAIRAAKKRGVRVTAETCPHYFSLTDESTAGFDTNFKMNPPLRSGEDVAAIIEGLKDGTIDAIATDHAPHPQYQKEKDFEHAPFGIIGFETAFGLAVRYLVEPGHLNVAEVIAAMTINAAQCFDLEAGSLTIGASADITIIDPCAMWTFTEESILSRAKNSPFIGERFTHQIIMTIAGGEIVYEK